MTVGHRLHLCGQMVKRLNEKAAGTRSGVEHGFPEARISDFDHEPHDRPRRIEFAGVTGSIAHLAQHGFIEGAKHV